ncbi:Integrator complex subunit 1 [Lamellibrachia satsuma]|nr:Integrator complex subunit 1 [Lamellibrachia satsuma]
MSLPDFPVLQVEKLELIDAVLNLCSYHHPENIVLPKGYEPPTLAISNLYWKAWTMLLIISAFNPATFGLTAWDSYPTLKCLMEMMMTNNYKFPPPTMGTTEQTVEEIKSKEKQVSRLERQRILEFEGHLAAGTSKVQITEANSLLLPQLITMDPSGIARRPPGVVLEQLKQLNQTLNIGSMLCRSRKPDFLLDVIRRQGTSQAMPWLAELVESSESSLDVLPVQCLCEFLLHDVPVEGSSSPLEDDDESKAEKYKRKQKQRKQQQLLGRLRSLLHDTASGTHTISEVLTHFLKRLSSTHSSTRQLAVKAHQTTRCQGKIQLHPWPTRQRAIKVSLGSTHNSTRQLAVKVSLSSNHSPPDNSLSR